MRVDIAAVLGPGCGDEFTATFRIALVPGGDVADDGFVDVGHGIVLALAYRRLFAVGPISFAR